MELIMEAKRWKDTKYGWFSSLLALLFIAKRR
jgi:hypothetical protein